MITPIYIYKCRLNRVVDGDTMILDVDVGFRITATITVRLRGLYAAESHEADGPAATARATALLTSATTIIVQTHKRPGGADIKSFDRYVADIYIDGTLLADLLVTTPQGIGAG